MTEQAVNTDDYRNIQLFRGEVIHDQFHEKDFRILYLPGDIAEPGYWICVSCNSNIPAPFNPDSLKFSLYTGKCVAVVDKIRAQQRSEDELSDAELEVRNRQFGLIKKAVQQEPSIYHRTERTGILRTIEESSGVKVNNLYKLLGRYWRGGMTIDALTPQYKNCGTGRKADFVAQKRL